MVNHLNMVSFFPLQNAVTIYSNFTATVDADGVLFASIKSVLRKYGAVLRWRRKVAVGQLQLQPFRPKLNLRIALLPMDSEFPTADHTLTLTAPVCSFARILCNLKL